MARLAHPNVLPIYEVGEADAQLFLVMELVDGGTLTGWLAERPRSPAAIVAAFVEAGRGLAAAHDAGLVHRDFKPDNVLVGADRRIRVTDFGLVGHGEAGADADADPSTSIADVRTRTGAILGTPAYAAPEVLARQPATVRSDQFSFAVALYEALYRQPPFAGDTVADLYAAVTAGAVRPPPSRRRAGAGARRDPARAGHRSGGALAVDGRAAGRAGGPAAPTVARVDRRWRGRGDRGDGGGDGGRRVDVTEPSAALPARASAFADRGPSRARAARAAHLDRGCAGAPIVRGDQVVYALDDGTGPSILYKVPLAGGAPVRMSDRSLGVPVAGSRPDRVLAILHEQPERLVEIDLSGTITDVPSPPALNSAIGFAWDGHELFYSRPDRVQIRAIAEGVEHPLVDLPNGWQATSIELSPDGRWLLVGTAGHAGACAIDRHAPVASPRCVELPVSRGTLLIVSPDEYLVTGLDGTWRRRFDDAAPARLLTPTLIDGAGMAIAGDGRTVVATMCLVRARLLGLPAGGGAPTVRLDDGRFMVPRARRQDGMIALARYVDTQSTTLSVRTSAGTLRDLTPRAHIVRSPSWDASGQLIAYRRGLTDGGIYVVDLEPSAPRRLTDDPLDSTPIFLADGRVAFSRMVEPGHVQMFLVDPASGAIGPAPRPERRAYDRHPDGRILVGDRRRHRLWLWDPVSDRETLVVASDDAAADAAQITADGAAILAVWGTELWRIGVADGKTTLAYKGAPDATHLEGATSLPDGTVVVSEGYYRGDLFVSHLPAADEPAR
jgi:serine/threonine protein kinase